MKQPRVTALGVKISCTNYSSTLNLIEDLITSNRKKYICVAAVHLIMECQKNEYLKDGVNRSILVTPDGMPLVWFSKFSGYSNVERVYGPDLTLKICRMAQENNFRIFILGGGQGQSKKMATQLKNRFPLANIVGYIDTPTRPISVYENKKIIHHLSLKKPHIKIILQI